MLPFLIIASFAAYAASQANPPPLVFDCGDRLEDVCTNMCWGAFCTVPAFGSTLDYDNYRGQGSGSQVARDRRRSAGCLPSPNRCSTRANPPNPRAGENCDEYPFASTAESDAGGQVSRCVISEHNSRQGAILSTYIQRNCNNVPCQLVIVFGNPGAPGVRYCQAANDRVRQCVNDGTPQIFKNGQPDVDFSTTIPPPPKVRRARIDTGIATVAEPTRGLFLLASGMEVNMPIDTAINSSVAHPVARNAALKSRADEDEEAEALLEWDFDESDYVVSRIS